ELPPVSHSGTRTDRSARLVVEFAIDSPAISLETIIITGSSLLDCRVYCDPEPFIVPLFVSASVYFENLHRIKELLCTAQASS
ncbi:MAG: hypothetical protein MHMPM18_004412, partial [Marteilia pararefringens]